MDLTIRLRDLADDWSDMGQPVKLRRSTVYELCEIVDDTELILNILENLELRGMDLPLEQKEVIERICKRTRNELNGLDSRNIL